MGNSATIFAQKNKPIYGRFIFRSTFAGISFPCVDYLFDYLMITELPKRPIYRHFQEQIAGIGFPISTSIFTYFHCIFISKKTILSRFTRFIHFFSIISVSWGFHHRSIATRSVELV
nr:MAG TPA: hypothetical protein [Caudoviricetes sp.]